MEGIVLLAHLPVPAGEEEEEGHWALAGRGEEAAVDQVARAHLQVACSQLQLAELAEDDLMKAFISKSQFAKNSKEVSTITITMCPRKVESTNPY